MITSYFDYMLYEKKGIPLFVEQLMNTLSDIEYKITKQYILPENDISITSEINVSYIDIKDYSIKRIGSNFKFDDFNFEVNKYTKCYYNIITEKNTTKDRFISHLSHEIHHSYQLYNIFKSRRTTDMNSSWKLNLKKQQFEGRNEYFDDFLYILYKSLGLEIDADIVGLYFKMKETGFSDENDVMNNIKFDGLYKTIKLIGNFDSRIFIEFIKEKAGIKELINEFNGSEIDINDFFNKWDKFFKRQYKKYNEKIKRLVDLITNEKLNSNLQSYE